MSNKIFSKFQQTIMISVAGIICAQIHFNLFNTDFKISIGILAFSVSLILFGKYPIPPVTFLAASGVLCSRVLMSWLISGHLNIMGYLPESIFYLMYGILFFTYCRKENYELKNVSFIPLFFFDYVSNLTELVLRSSNETVTINTHLSILLVAFSRTLIIWFIFICLNYYKFSLLTLEHAERYKRLLLLISRLNDEIVLMRKNTKMVEETMNTSYKLFQDMKDQNVDPDLSRKALSVARDVHELKKEYMIILRGLSDAMELNLKDEGMYLDDILLIIKNSLLSSLPEGKTLTFDIQTQENLYTQKHYFLMSILRNLYNNALEASTDPLIHLQFVQTETLTDYVLLVEDNGPGIEPDDLEQIFSPGFSTKINYATGEINRGLGLNIVEELIEHQFCGTITVNSAPGKTIFTIHIPKKCWKGDYNEHLSN